MSGRFVKIYSLVDVAVARRRHMANKPCDDQPRLGLVHAKRMTPLHPLSPIGTAEERNPIQP